MAHQPHGFHSPVAVRRFPAQSCLRNHHDSLREPPSCSQHLETVQNLENAAHLFEGGLPKRTCAFTAHVRSGSDMTLLLQRAPTMALAVSERIAALTALAKASLSEFAVFVRSYGPQAAEPADQSHRASTPSLPPRSIASTAALLFPAIPRLRTSRWLWGLKQEGSEQA